MRFSHFAIALLLVVGFAADALAQVPPTGAPTGRGRGGGSGRTVRVMTLTSSGFKDGEVMPDKYSQPGEVWNRA